MIDRRNFLRLGALFVPAAIVEPRRVYSFIWARPEGYVWVPVYDARQRDISYNHVSIVSPAFYARMAEHLAERLEQPPIFGRDGVLRARLRPELFGIDIKGTVSI